MRIYEGSPRQDFEEVLRSIGAFLDQRGMRDVLLVEAPDGFILQGLALEGEKGAWAENAGHQVKETMTFLDDDIARFMEEALARRHADSAAPDWATRATMRSRSGSSGGGSTRRSRTTSSSSSRTARSSSASTALGRPAATTRWRSSRRTTSRR